MAEYARKLIAGNPSLGERITVRSLSVFLPVNVLIIHFSYSLCGYLHLNTGNQR